MNLENSGERWSSPRERLAAALTEALLTAERRLGRDLDRSELAKRVNISPSSLYAYLNATTLPRGSVFDRLLDELGVDGAERGRLATLRDTAEVARRVGRGTRVRPVVPRQLPADTRQFVRRTDELAQLVRIASTPLPDAARTCVIEGVAGVGKSTLATRAAHRVEHLFPDGQLYADLRGFAATPPLDPADVLLSFLQALGAPVAAIPSAPSARAALYRSLLAGRRVLVVLDNADSSERVRPLVPAAPGCLLLVTSRNRMDSLVTREGAARIALDVMAYSEAAELLAARIGPDRVAGEPDAVRTLVDLCGGLPLALSLLASRAKNQPDEPLATFAKELQKSEDRLTLLSLPDTDLDLTSVFTWSYDALTGPAARLFRMLGGVHPGPGIGIAACTALAGTTRQPRQQLRELVSANLVIEQSLDRFSLHDLMRSYARDRAERDDSASERRAALRRVLDYYLSSAAAANARIQPDDVEERSAVSPMSGTYAEAMAWFSVEHEALLALVVRAAGNGLHSYAWRLAWECMVFLRRSGRYKVRIEIQRLAVSAARRAGDRAALATSCRMLADALARSRQSTGIWALLAEALALFEGLGDVEGAFRVHLSFVRALDAEGEHNQALEHAETALHLIEAKSNPPELADALAATARQLTHLGRTAAALDRAVAAVRLYSAAGNTEGEASGLKIIGDAELRRGHPSHAIVAYERSLSLDRALGDRYWEAHGLLRLAAAHRELGDTHTAERLRESAIVVLESLHHPDAWALYG